MRLKAPADDDGRAPEKRGPPSTTSSQDEEEYSEESEDVSDEEDNEDEEDEEEEEEEEEDEDAEEAGPSSWETMATVVPTTSFEELQLPIEMIEAMRGAWQAFLSSVGTPLLAGEAIYSAIFDSAPSLQSMFKTPRAVQAMRFMDALAVTCNLLDQPTNLKQATETLGFCHLNIEVTEPRIAVTREAILDLLASEAAEKFTPTARLGWAIVLNWVAGSFIYVRNEYKGRLDILSTSWSCVGHGYTKHQAGGDSGEVVQEVKANSNNKDSSDDTGLPQFNQRTVPTTFEEMFLFNASVMGFGRKRWMEDVLGSFDSIVKSVYDSKRLQDECNVLAILLSTYKGQIKLNEFCSVMMASLRSLLPKNWGSQHEMAWSWLWTNVQQMLKGALGQPAKQEKSLRHFYLGLDEDTKFKFRMDIYNTFFEKCAQGQEYFKQSSTRLHFIVDRITELTLGIYTTPKKVIDEISALGLRHVGYGIPVDLFGPFVTSCIEVLAQVTQDAQVQESFRWSLGLVSRVLVRTIEQGSTIVMRAINQNDSVAFKKAVSCAPRGERAEWLLKVQVGSQSISPLMWAIKSGALNAAKSVLEDLLTIRADRDHYYYAVDDLFERHPDIVQQLCINAPMLLPTLLDGLIWRANQTMEGQRRVHYYIRNLIVEPGGEVSQSFTSLITFGDPKIICHPSIHFTVNLMWTGVACAAFLKGKAWFVFSLIVFVVCQAVLEPIEKESVMNMHEPNLTRSTVIMVGRALIYMPILGQLIWHHCSSAFVDYRLRDVNWVGRFPVPTYLNRWYEWVSLVLCLVLIVMMGHEPVLLCLNAPEVQTTEGLERIGNMLHCNEIHGQNGYRYYRYSIFSMIAMMLYFALILDMHSCFERISAFALVCGRIAYELFLHLCAFCFLVAAFACGIATLDHGTGDLLHLNAVAVELTRLAFGLWGDREFHLVEQDGILLIMVMAFALLSAVFFLNILIAQLTMAYSNTFEDMLGYARLCRGRIILEVLDNISPNRWGRFIESLQLDQPLKFNEGDYGPAGGLATYEPALEHIVTTESILRYGGTTEATAAWPETKETVQSEENSKFDRLEKALHKAMKRINHLAQKMGADGGSSVESSAMPSALSSSWSSQDSRGGKSRKNDDKSTRS